MSSLHVRLGKVALMSAMLVSIAACGQWAQGAAAGVAGGTVAVRGATAQDDAVSRAILAGGAAPRTIFEVRERLLARGGKLKTHIVANRGHDNPESGSFSFFETYTGPMAGGSVRDGELFIGFFSERQGDRLAVQQSFAPGLMIELIAWDYTKQLYNFWELVGTGSGSTWHYRGDTNDVLADVAAVETGGARPAFGNRLRCSGCHTLGGPIMKELDGPHNDWWTNKGKLALGSLKLETGSDALSPTQTAGRLFRDAEDASSLAKQVRGGIDRLVASRLETSGNVRARLRSLFATMELNLVSDTRPFAARADVALPTSFFVDARLASGAAVTVPRARYERALAASGSRFAPDEAPGLVESHHAFVVPARSYIDNRMIDALVRQGLLDAELVADVLAVDFTTPVYSERRAALLRHVPTEAADAAELRRKLVSALMKAPEPAAKELLANLTDPTRTAAFHRKQAQAYLAKVRSAASGDRAPADWLAIASQRRAEIDAADTAQNPRGKISEPGFRVIFPVDRLGAKPHRLRLDPATGLIAGRGRL